MCKFVELLIQSLTKINGKTFYLFYWKGQIMNNHIWSTCCFPQPKVREGLFSKKKIFGGWQIYGGGIQSCQEDGFS